MEEPIEEMEKTKEEQGEQPAGEMEKGEVADELAALRQELEATKAKECEYLDGWQRARAELANARKRFQREQEQSYSNARGDLMVRLLPILDDFERAFETLPANLSRLTWIEGVVLIYRKLQLLVEQAGVIAIEAMGQKFDPMQHEAVTHEPSDTVPEGTVIAELQKGYKLGDRVLRPSVVRVSSGPLPEPPSPEDEQRNPSETAATADDAACCA